MLDWKDIFIYVKTINIPDHTTQEKDLLRFVLIKKLVGHNL